MVLPRRALVVIALMFWQGGFMFYSAIVVPIGQEVLGSHLDQGFITRRVTNYLNLVGVVALLPMFWDVCACRAGPRRWRWAALAGLVGALAVLAWMHVRLDNLLDIEQQRILDRQQFQAEHQWYLLVTTFQWSCGMAYTVLTLAAWWAEDHQ